MRIDIVGQANLAQAEAQFAQLTGQVEALNRAMARTAMVPQGGSMKGFQQQVRAMRAADAAFNASLASSGKFRVEQLRLNDVLDKQVTLMQKQKSSFRQMWGREHRQTMRSVYREQLALNNLAAKATTGGVSDGRLRATLAIPTEVHKSWDTLNNRVGFFGHQLASASTALQNWGKNTQWAGRQMMAGISMPIAAFGAAAGYMAYQVDKQMTRIQKVYDTTANANSQSAEEQMRVDKELAKVRADAMQTGIKAARDYGAAITDTLEVQAELAATGQRGAALQANTNEVMRISMLGEIDRADTTKALIALQSTLGLNTKETADAFNYMNSIENATSLTMNDFAQAIPRAAAPIKMMGGDIKDLGLLLVAMRERGINAAEGANAIKAMMQRLYRPSKQIREEWQQIAGIDPLALVREEGGDIMKILPRISDAVKNLNREERVQALAGLFGTYQVTRMNAMLEGIDDMGDKTKQTYRAIQVAGNSAEENAKIAQREQQKAAQSAAGQLQRQWETLRAQIASIGEPFLQVATLVLKGLGAIATAFNKMPDPAKKMAAWLAIGVALFGPLVMLTGLFANLAGSAGKLMATLIKSTSSFELLTKAQVGERIAAALTKQAFEQEASAAQVLTGQIMALNDAMAINSKVMASNAGINYNALSQQTARQAAIARQGPTSRRASEIYDRSMGSKAGSQVFVGHTPPGMTPKEMERAYATNDKVTKEMANTSKEIAKNSEKTSKFMAGAAASGAVMAASMTTMMVTSNETANSIAQFALMAALLGPMFKGAGVLIKNMTGNLVKAAAAHRAASVAAASTNAATAATAAKAGGLRAAFMGAGKGAAAMLNPVGLTITAIAAVGFGVKKWLDHEEKVTQEKIKQSRATMDQKNLANEALKISQKQLKVLDAPTAAGPGEPDLAPTKVVAAEIKGSESGLIKHLRDEETSSAEKATIAMEKYAQVLRSTGGSAAKAERYIEAMFVAAGDGALEAQMKANKALQALGTGIDENEQAELWARLGREAMDEWGSAARNRGTDIGKQVADAIANGADAQDTLTRLENAMAGNWSAVFAKVPKAIRDDLAKLGLDTSEEFKAALEAWDNPDVDFGKWAMDEFNLSAEKALDLQFAMNSARSHSFDERMGQADVEESIVQELGKQLLIDDKRLKTIKTMGQLRETYEFKLLQASVQEALKLYQLEVLRQNLKNGSDIKDPAKREANNAKKLALAQMAAAATGQEVVFNLSEQEVILQRAAQKAEENKNQITGTAGAVRKVKDELRGIPMFLRIALNFDGSQMTNIQKAGMEGATNDYADALSRGFDERMAASLEKTDNYWNGRIEAAQAAGERASQALDNKWERIGNRFEARWEGINFRFERRWERRNKQVEEYYDKRIKGVDAAIKREERAEEIRQKIFEAEKTRMQRASQMANQTIDFNMALRTGDLDEAAKIKNDMESTVQDWMLSDASDKSQSQSERRIENLNARKDKYEEARERAKEALKRREQDEKRSLEKRERAEKASLDRREKREKAALERRTKANQDALQRQATAARNAAQNRWNMEKRSFDRRLELFKSYIARDQKDLERWMTKVGFSYDQFGAATKKKGESWSQYFENSMVSHMRAAAMKMASDNSWGALGKRNATQVARGMGFKNMNQFKKFITDGVIPDTFGQDLTKQNKGGRKPGTGKSPVKTLPNGEKKVGNTGLVHTGGWVGDNVGGGSRKGVARTLKGAHQSEHPMLLRKKEFVVNEHAATKFGPQLEAMNKGIDPTPPIVRSDSVRNQGDGVGGAGPLSGLAGLVMGAMGNGLMQGIGAVMRNAVAEKKAQLDEQAAFAALFAIGNPGAYGDRSFNRTQLKNAATIASVGSGMGMSKRDIMIGIMTAITESNLINVDYGDRDSLGLFQQRPSMDWGTAKQVQDPVYAATAFFKALKGVKNRGDMTPWAAAQKVQRSGTPDGSNYRQFWDNAQLIFNNGLKKTETGYGVVAATGGSGGKHPPSKPGKGWNTSHDYRNGANSPLYAFNDGRVIESRGIRSGGSSKYPGFPRGYRSYGETIVIRDNAGNTVRYAHLQPGTRAPIGAVKGGALVGLSGMTGNASNWHTHFEFNGHQTGAQSDFAKYGIGLRTGAVIKKDGMANIHKDEAVISPKRTKNLYSALDQFGDVMNKVSRTTKLGFSGEQGGLNPGIQGVTGWLVKAFGDAVSVGSSNTAGTTGSMPKALGKDSGRKAVLRLGAYNLLHTTSNKASKADLTKLMKLADVISLTEVEHTRKALLGNWLREQGWGWYRAQGSTSADSAITWNNRKLQMTEAGSRQLNPRNYRRGGARNRYAAWVGLRDRKSGRAFYQIAAHTTNHGKLDPATHRLIQNEQWASLRNLYGDLKRTGRPVFLAGDLNAPVGRVNQIAPGLRTSSKKGIDHIMADPRFARLMAHSRFFGNLASDHPAVISRYNLPQMKKGGEVRFDNTLANLHKDETVLTAGLSKEFATGVKNFASGASPSYNVEVNLHGADVDANDVAVAVMTKFKQQEARKPRARR